MLNLTLNTTKNLLAFSGGIDSTALFFILLENNIPFDIAIVDYNVRAQSKEEVEYAKTLAKNYHKQCYHQSIVLDNQSNFEKKARDIRYTFFEELIHNHNYETLITAHQLDDQLEWFLMQLSKGAGLFELIGFQEEEQKDSYKLYRPLLQTTKDQLLTYLQSHSIQYFIDASNEDTKYQRNFMRKHFSQNFIKEYAKGVKDSFTYLKKDVNSLMSSQKILFQEKELQLLYKHFDDNLNIRTIDHSLKQRGLLLSKAQRDEILLQKELVVSHKFSISIMDDYIWIAPYVTNIMSKEFKEKCRILKVPKNIRGYLFSIKFDLNNLTI